jgi:hypothetical protein
MQADSTARVRPEYAASAAALDTARQPFRSGTWMAALSVITGRDGGDFGRTRRLGAARLRAGSTT